MQNFTPIQFFSDMLTILDYKGDREEFASAFHAAMKDQLLSQLLPLLPQEERQTFSESFRNQGSFEDTQKIMLRYFDKNTYFRHLVAANQKVFGRFFSTLEHQVTPEQQQQIKVYLATRLQQLFGTKQPAVPTRRDL